MPFLIKKMPKHLYVIIVYILDPLPLLLDIKIYSFVIKTVFGPIIAILTSFYIKNAFLSHHISLLKNSISYITISGIIIILNLHFFTYIYIHLFVLLYLLVKLYFKELKNFFNDLYIMYHIIKLSI